MPDKEYTRLQEALKQSQTEEGRKASAEAMRRYLRSKEISRGQLKTKRKGSTPMLVTLGLKKGYPTAIRLADLPDEMERNPEIVKLLQEVLKS